MLYMSVLWYFRMQQEFQIFLSSMTFQLPMYAVCNSESPVEDIRHFHGNTTAYSKMNSYKFISSGVFKGSNSSWLKNILRHRGLFNEQHDQHLVSDVLLVDLFPLELDFVTRCDFSRIGQTDPDCSCLTDDQNHQRQDQNLDAVSWFTLKFIFLALDIGMLAFRLSHICFNVQKMCNGFEEVVSLELTDIEWKCSAPVPEQVAAEQPSSGTNCLQNHSGANNSITELTENREFSEKFENLKDSSNSFVPNHHYRLDKMLASRQPSFNRVSTMLAPFRSDLAVSTRALKSSMVVNRKVKRSNCEQFFKMLVKGMCESNFIPVLIPMTLLLFFISLGMRFIEQMLNPVLLFNFNGFLAAMRTLTVHTNSTNDYLTSVADLHTADIFHYYARHMVYELSFLQGIAELYLTGNFAWINIYF